ncbi:MAG: hypothetical protein IT328_01920 [Caldilineaceae bacterium]|nr:hypothetical protein [Caldilineaceae bacterium]
MRYLLHGLLGGALILTALWLGARPAQAQFSYMPLLHNGDVPLCRLGINGALGSYPTKPLRLGWYIDYTSQANDVPGTSYFPVIRLRQITDNSYEYSIAAQRASATEAQLRAAVAARLGHYWLIGNEPDRLLFQDDIDPHVYATAYHDLYQIIKDEDPTAKVVAGTIVQPTPLRLQYLDLVLSSYYQTYKQAMPVDGWAFHNFILNEVSCSHFAQFFAGNPEGLRAVCWGADIPPGVDAVEGLRVDVQDNDDIELFKEQVIRFRQWMADRGYRNTPAFLSEFGILMPQGWYEPDFTPERVNTFMNESFDFLMTATDPNTGYPADDNRLVQRFAWYSVDDKSLHNGYLFDRDLPHEISLTNMGSNFINYGNAMKESVDFSALDLTVTGAPPLTSQGATTVTLEAVIGNSGNLGVGKGATVRFFNGDPSSGGVQIGKEQMVSLQGCGEQSTVRLAWGGVAPGEYTVYVDVRSNAAELDTSNNQRSVKVSFTDQQLLIPDLRRDLTIP